MDSHLIWQTTSEMRRQLKRLWANGIRWIREDFPWEAIERSRSAYDWTRTDHLMAAAARAGIRVLAIVDYSAPWASSDPSGRGDKLYPPAHPATFATYAAAIASRYGSQGDFWTINPAVPRLTLGAEELWNEPYGYWFWKTGPDPAAYARLVMAAAPAVHAADPGMTVLASGDLLAINANQTASPWVARVIDAAPDIGHAIDAWSVHPYPSPWTLSPSDLPSSPYSFGRVVAIRSLLDAQFSTKPIWLTEFGWSTAPQSSEAVNEATQATYIRQAITTALGTWGNYVDKAFVYSWDTSSSTPGDRAGNYGLRRADESTKPAWDAIGGLLSPVACAYN
jgi:hypothetical protein